MMRARRGFWVLFALTALYAAVFAGWAWRGRIRARRLVTLQATAPSAFHDALVELELRAADPALAQSFADAPPVAVVERGTQTVTTIGGLRELKLAPAGPGRWAARWPVPWNAEPGEYRPRLLARPELAERLRERPFLVRRRSPAPLPRGFVAATLENAPPLAALKVRGPDGRETDWRGLVDWAQSLGADAFWMLGGQTPGPRGELWNPANVGMIPKVAAECRRRGLKFGVYAMYSLTVSSTVKIAGYEYGMEIENGRPVPTRAVSIRERKRLDDVAAFLKPFAKDPNVDMIGVDYIRNALGGCELVDDFAAEMPGVRLPPEWARLSKDERMLWLARKKAMRADAAFVDQWQWWRAHRVAGIVRELKSRLGVAKPMWAFTLTWDKGWNHGQDPVMMNDAGIDYDALMFYEADKEQFAAMLHDWHAYARAGDVQLVPGNIFDWGLHQKDPAGPAEFGRRLRAAVAAVYGDAPARAVFYHDVGRLLWGRLGAWGTAGWAAEAREISRSLKAGAAAQEKRP